MEHNSKIDDPNHIHYDVTESNPPGKVIRFKSEAEFKESIQAGFITKDSGEREHFTSGMQRDTEKGKPRYDLCWNPLYKRWAELMGRGAEKYGANNWQKASGQIEYDRFKSSAERHLQQLLQGDRSEDHAAAVCFNLGGMEFVRERMIERGETPK